MSVGRVSRWIFTALTIVALVVLGSLYRATRDGELRPRRSRSRSCRRVRSAISSTAFAGRTGVVDFIDVGIGMHRFRTFNVADWR